MIYTLNSLLCVAMNTAICRDGKYVPARPHVAMLPIRIKAAWMVLLGRADAVVWPEGQ